MLADPLHFITLANLFAGVGVAFCIVVLGTIVGLAILYFKDSQALARFEGSPLYRLSGLLFWVSAGVGLTCGVGWAARAVIRALWLF